MSLIANSAMALWMILDLQGTKPGLRASSPGSASSVAASAPSGQGRIDGFQRSALKFPDRIWGPASQSTNWGMCGEP